MAALDDRDQAMVAERLAKLDQVEGPRVGDWVIFASGESQRISYVWDWPEKETDNLKPGVQTSKGGSFYLGCGYVSMSGLLDPVVPMDTLVLTGEVREGAVWVFSHDLHSAGNGVDTVVSFRVYRTSCVDPRNPMES